MKITRLKIQGFRTVNRGFDCLLNDMTVFVGRNNAGKSCAVRALNLFFNHSDDPAAFLPHIRVNPGSTRKKRFSIIVGIWLTNIPNEVKFKYKRFLTSSGELPIRLYFAPTDNLITYSCFKKGFFSATKTEGEEVKGIISDLSAFISLRVIPETRDLAREFQTELGHGFQALKQTVLAEAETKSSKEAKAYKSTVESIINSQLVMKINANLGSVIPGQSTSIGNIDQIAFSRMVLSSIIDQLPIYAQNSDSEGLSIEQMGAGFQSAVLVSLYRTVAQLKGKQLILCVEEPEIHLDSHSQRYCYHHWSEQVKTENDLNQVLITSHSAFLVDEASPDQLVLVKRDGDGCTATAQLTETFLNSIDLVKLSTKTLGLHNTDLFFSGFVVLVEGEGDTVAYRGYLELLLKSKGSSLGSLSLSGVAVIDCGVKDGIRALAQVVAQLGIPHISIFDKDVIQKTDTQNRLLIGQQQVEKTYLKEISNDFKNQFPLFPSETSFNKSKSIIESKLKAGVQSGFPQAINGALGLHGILMMRTEHETDIVYVKNMALVADLFAYDLTDFEAGNKAGDEVIKELKAFNKKELKKAFVTAKLVSKTDSMDQVPYVYAKMCGEIYKRIMVAGLSI
jgi:predicted ATP-dependent endonuclease of OLD family